ncbi:tetratricopeptide repeat protein [Streptomyces sp. TLI_146]|uniref:CHAT domain-containing tetratricopeptide repeat protein n=1 Tax=Streptomyces sp. TLI_146 TaxID=1938858 RepID=UPI000C70B1EE|nr:tetratricopeptide repeat protein [Streptomyces sp. TLI_146]PKV86344.1 tetratricopeptide repeat protein [Streptomyces sp. TLI_146]
MTEPLAERLLVDLRDDGRVQVSSWPAAEHSPRTAGEPVELVWPLDEQEMADLRWYLEQYLRMPFGVYEQRGPRVAERLPEWGARIFSALFATDEAKRAYTEARTRGGPLEIVLRSGSAERLGLPWELMADPARPVPIVLDQVAVSRSLQTTDTRHVFTVPGSRLRVLMVISRPDGEADVGYQMIARPLLRRLEAVRGSVELVVLRPPTLERLEEVLTRAREDGEPFQVVHFDGHGVFGPPPASGGWGPMMFQKSGPQGMLAFEKSGGGSDLVPAGRVAQVLAGAQVPVAVLNACQSAVVGSQVEAAVATRLMQEGVASVVAMAYSVYAVAAAEFMAAFYERLFAGDRMAEAVAAGRRRLALNDERPSLKGMLPLDDWMVPVFYTRSEVRFPGLRTERESEESLDGILDAISRRPEDGRQPGPGQELAPEGEFIGRDALFYRLDVAARLQRVVVLHGPGGTGKTELAKAFGRWCRDTGAVDRPEWVIWHSFEPGVASFGLDGVVNAIGRRVFAEKYDTQFVLLDAAQRLQAVERALRTRRVLLLWDNFESVRAMPDPGQATPPLPEQEQDEMRDFLSRLARDSRASVVITSRSDEDWLGETVRRIRVDGLDTEEATQYAEQLLAPYPHTRRARESRAFGEVMRWLDGHPLSMRLVLPHLDTTSAQDLLDGLRGVRALPGNGNGGRTTSLAASIAYSFDHLAEEDQRALTALSLLQGVADANVLGAFSAGQGVPEQFRGLPTSAWRELLERASALGLLSPGVVGTYRIHPALPAYLADRWKAQAADAYDDQRTASVRALLGAHVEFSRWLSDRLDGEHAQLGVVLAATHRRMLGSMLGHALDQRMWSHAQFIAQLLDVYWDMRGLGEEARGWTARIRRAVEGPVGSPLDLDTPAGALWAYTTGSQANRDLLAGQLDQAESTYRSHVKAMLAGRETPAQRKKLASVYHQIGMVAQHRGRLTEAEEWYLKSLAIEELIDNQDGMASSYHQLGIVSQLRGRMTEAEEWYHKSLAIAEALSNRHAIMRSYHSLGMIAQHRGRQNEAEEWYHKARAIAEGLGNRPAMSTTYHQLGIVSQLRGRLTEAAEWYHASLAIAESLGNRPGMSGSYHQLGIISQLQGRLTEAEEWYQKSLAIKEDLGDRASVATGYHQLGAVDHMRGRLEGAERWYRKSLDVEEELGNRPGMATSYHSLALIAQLRGRSAEAEEGCRKALAIWKDLEDLPGLALTCGTLGALAFEQNRPDSALEWMVRCVSQFEEIPHPETGNGPLLLQKLTELLGISALERTWQSVTANPLPAAVRQYVLAHPPAPTTE